MPESMMMRPMPVEPVSVAEVATLGKPSVSRSVLVKDDEELAVRSAGVRLVMFV